MIDARTFGDVRAAVLSAGELHYTPPFAGGLQWRTDDTVIDADGLAAIGVNSLYAEVGDARLVIDPATFAPGETLPRARLVAHAGIDASLAELGVDPASVTHVLVTHLHSDHLNGFTRADGAPRFPNARHVVPRLDREAYAGDEELAPYLDAVALELAEPDQAVSDRVRFIHTGGESPGHQAVAIDTGAGRLVYLGDLVHFPAEVAHFGWLGVRGRDAADLQAGRERVLGAPDRTTYVFTHGRFPPWGVVEDGAWRYTFPAQGP